MSNVTCFKTAIEARSAAYEAGKGGMVGVLAYERVERENTSNIKLACDATRCRDNCKRGLKKEADVIELEVKR